MWKRWTSKSLNARFKRFFPSLCRNAIWVYLFAIEQALNVQVTTQWTLKNIVILNLLFYITSDQLTAEVESDQGYQKILLISLGPLGIACIGHNPISYMKQTCQGKGSKRKLIIRFLYGGNTEIYCNPKHPEFPDGISSKTTSCPIL